MLWAVGLNLSSGEPSHVAQPTCGADHLHQGNQVFCLCAKESDPIIERERCGCHEQGEAAGDNHYALKLMADGHVPAF
jgi:hypothetical protein